MLLTENVLLEFYNYNGINLGATNFLKVCVIV